MRECFKRKLCAQKKKKIETLNDFFWSCSFPPKNGASFVPHFNWVSLSSLTMKKTTTTITKTTSRTTSARRRTTRSTTTTVDDGNDAKGETTTTTTKKTSSSKSSSSTASTLMMDAFLRRIDDEETTQPSSSNMSLVALASRIEKECFPRLEEKDIPTTNDDDVGDGVVRARKRRLGQNDDAISSTNFSPPLFFLIGRLTLSLLFLSSTHSLSSLSFSLRLDDDNNNNNNNNNRRRTCGTASSRTCVSRRTRIQTTIT